MFAYACYVYSLVCVSYSRIVPVTRVLLHTTVCFYILQTRAGDPETTGIRNVEPVDVLIHLADSLQVRFLLRAFSQMTATAQLAYNTRND